MPTFSAIEPPAGGIPFAVPAPCATVDPSIVSQAVAAAAARAQMQSLGIDLTAPDAASQLAGLSASVDANAPAFDSFPSGPPTDLFSALYAMSAAKAMGFDLSTPAGMAALTGAMAAAPPPPDLSAISSAMDLAQLNAAATALGVDLAAPGGAAALADTLNAMGSLPVPAVEIPAGLAMGAQVASMSGDLFGINPTLPGGAEALAAAMAAVPPVPPPPAMPEVPAMPSAPAIPGPVAPALALPTPLLTADMSPLNAVSMPNLAGLSGLAALGGMGMLASASCSGACAAAGG